jgi:hypothetical protein
MLGSFEGLDSKKESLFCPVRKEWIKALPEELVRQKLLCEMLSQLGYPLGLLAVEKAVRQLPHLSAKEKNEAPDRRVDILCFAKDKSKDGTLLPLLTIECKSVKLSKRAVDQILGYNHYIRSSFIAIANGQEILTGWFDSKKGDYHFIDYLPPYEALLVMNRKEGL